MEALPAKRVNALVLNVRTHAHQDFAETGSQTSITLSAIDDRQDVSRGIDRIEDRDTDVGRLPAGVTLKRPVSLDDPKTDTV